MLQYLSFFSNVSININVYVISNSFKFQGLQVKPLRKARVSLQWALIKVSQVLQAHGGRQKTIVNGLQCRFLSLTSIGLKSCFFNTLFGNLSHFGQNVLHLVPKQKRERKKEENYISEMRYMYLNRLRSKQGSLVFCIIQRSAPIFKCNVEQYF